MRLDPAHHRYHGHHRDNDMPKGVGLIPLGDRNRVLKEEGIGILEERISIDKYTKYSKHVN